MRVLLLSRSSVILAIACYEESGLSRLLLNNYSVFNSKEKLESIHTLVSRPGYGWQLTQALKENRVPRRDVPPDVARQLRRVVGSGFVEVWGPIDQLPSVENAYKKYRRSEERRVGKECVSTCRSRWSPYH